VTPHRLRPLAESERDAQATELLASDGPFPGAADSNFFATLARHPGLFRKWVSLGSKLLFAGKLPDRDRELLILRVAWLCQEEYEWAHHVEAARQAGLSSEQVDAVPSGGHHPVWNKFDAALLNLVDDLHSSHGASDATWVALAEVYDEKQLIEAVAVVGMYTATVYLLKSCGVTLEDAKASAPGLSLPARPLRA
jgi:alkylhydroperoxidase family enzyme